MGETINWSGEVKLSDSIHHGILELRTNKSTVKPLLSGSPIKQTPS